MWWFGTWFSAGFGSSGLMVEHSLKVFSNLNDPTIKKGLGNILE